MVPALAIPQITHFFTSAPYCSGPPPSPRFHLCPPNSVLSGSGMTFQKCKSDHVTAPGRRSQIFARASSCPLCFGLTDSPEHGGSSPYTTYSSCSSLLHCLKHSLSWAFSLLLLGNTRRGRSYTSPSGGPSHLHLTPMTAHTSSRDLGPFPDELKTQGGRALPVKCIATHPRLTTVGLSQQFVGN